MRSSSDFTRRDFIGAAVSAGVLSTIASSRAANAVAGDRAMAGGRSSAPGMKLGLDVGDNDEVLLRFMKQIGVEWVATSLKATQGDSISPELTRGVVMSFDADGATGGIGGPPGGPSGPWKKAEVERLVRRIESAGLKLGAVYLHSFPNAVLGNSLRDRDIEHVRQSIALAGQFGIPVLLYNFFGLRNVEGLYMRPGRGGASYRAFDDSRVKDQSPLPGLGVIDDEQMWEHLKYFLQGVVPAAEASGIRLAQHPNDPPVPTYRGIADPFDSIAHWKRLVDAVPSPSNGIVLETGVTAELGGNVEETIRYFGTRDRINHVHFRNVRTERPTYSYVETFIDNGQNDMLAAMRTLHEVGYSHMIVPDHSPHIADDKTEFGAWGYALGYMKALMRAVGA